jgi:hypothetical protein
MSVFAQLLFQSPIIPESCVKQTTLTEGDGQPWCSIWFATFGLFKFDCSIGHVDSAELNIGGPEQCAIPLSQRIAFEGDRRIGPPHTLSARVPLPFGAGVRLAFSSTSSFGFSSMYRSVSLHTGGMARSSYNGA